ncbi:DUF2147 domain-containing protein [Sulfitobacter aestuarii]|uniref:DUF2147 domain-containing protein n=1 Tax=Sulfitobacter aestuarii TaxID=2161676 RepID=A0ABW5TZ52_9RHOB
MHLLRILIGLAFITALPISATAQEAMAHGVWKSTPDRNGLVVHVRTKPCGAALCGTVERAKDRRGYDKRSSAVGRKIIWDMKPASDGVYRGKLWERDRNRTLDARLSVEGNALRLQQCDDNGCKDVIWTRLR